ncbi:MAG: asparagine synthase (glutamine-hydrolyzing) [bacterium]|nr:asparagine synthase (glutamine-hydrolyzing) [bacterium]
MCGICGYLDLEGKKRIDPGIIEKMTDTLHHRGPDGREHYIEGNLGFGFTRLSIIGLEGGMQPLFNEDKTVAMICNGEIFNYIELRDQLKANGHTFRTHTDVEVLVHLYEEYGTDLLNRLNGQFSFAIYDFKKQHLFCARDHFGVLPFYYTVSGGQFIFGSEIKAILQHPKARREVDPVGLDQVFSFPGMISPRTMFKDIKSLENGHYLLAKGPDNITTHEYWDVIYPEKGHMPPAKSESYYIEKLDELITQSVRLRLRSDVPVGLYISGGLDSSITTALTQHLTPNDQRYSFAIDFIEKEISESKYQRIMSDYVNSKHFEIVFRFDDISNRLQKSIYHCECPIKESYNTCSLALSESVRAQDIKVILTGEGSDEFFAGYVGYRFDKMRQMQPQKTTPETPYEEAIRRKLWGDPGFFYEKNHHYFGKIKRDVYSGGMKERMEDIDSLNHFIVNTDRLKNRDHIQRRSYLDYKLRLADHLISDHGDRMAMANSVEARYPFLDKDLVEFATTIPADMKLMDFQEKYILKKMSEKYVPKEIVNREKFGFVAPGSPYLLKRNIEFINDLLSYDTIKRQGFFDPDAVEDLKKEYTADGYTVNVPFDSDLLIIVLTHGILQEQFQLPAYS